MAHHIIDDHKRKEEIEEEVEKKKEQKLFIGSRAPWLRWRDKPGVSMMERMVHHTRQRLKLCHRLVVFFGVQSSIGGVETFCDSRREPGGRPQGRCTSKDHVLYRPNVVID